MRVEQVTDAAGLAELSADWRRLERADSFYTTERWVTAWWAAHADDPALALRVLVVRQNDDVVGIAPLVLRRRSRGSTTTTVAAWANHGDYLDVLVDADGPVDTVCKHLVEHLLDELTPDGVRLGNLPEDSPLLHWLLRSPHNGDVRLHVENPYIDLRRYAGLDDFVGRSLPAKTRKYRNKLHRERPVTFRVFRGDEDDVLARIAAVHLAEKQHLVDLGRQERHSLFEDPRRVAQVRAVFATDALTFGYEDEDGTLVGYRTCWRQGRTLLSWNSAYLPAYEDYRIGKVLQLDILEHLFATGDTDVFDLGAGRYAWKFEWTPTFSSSYRWLRKPPTAPAAPQRPARAQPSGPPPGSVPPAPAPPSGGLARRVVRSAAEPARTARRTVRRRSSPPVIYYAPHPDDETIFMGASLARAARDRRVLLVPLTRGGASSARRRLSTRLGRDLDIEEFMAARCAELGEAAARLGLRGEDLRWQDLTDGEVAPAEVLEIIAEQERRHPGASHRTMSYLDPHRDHAAAGEALQEAYRSGVVGDALFHLPVSHVPERWGTRVRLSARDLEAKRAALRAYQVWDPEHGRLAVGQVSVTDLIAAQLHHPVERTHGPGYQP